MLKIVADNKIPFLKGALEPYAEVQYLPGADIDKQALKSADALITRTRTKCNESTLEGSSLKLIASATIGFDHIDTVWCEKNNIAWTNAPGCNSESVKQYVGAVLALLIDEKGWTLSDKSIAIVGVGNVGGKVSAMAKVLGMTVYEVDPPRARLEKDKRYYELNDVISKADIITCHTPLTRTGQDATYHLFNRELLKQMKSSAVLLNTSRGEVVDNKALKTALQEKQIELAVLDVWENEPQLNTEFLDLVWIATPHIAGYSQDGKAKGTEMSVRAISRFFNLGIDDWEAFGIPEPDESLIEMDGSSQTNEQLIAKAILHTYPIKEDDAVLRKDITQFEYLRGAYPVRREFKAYQVDVGIDNMPLNTGLNALGFKIKE